MVSAVLLQSFIWISLMATGVQYDITHIISSMCVVRQSTVLIPCKYTHPEHEQVSAVEWLHEKSPEKKVRVSQDPAFEGRVELQADAGNCSLLLRDVNESDAGIFRFVLSTGSGRNWTNAQGIRLEVTDAEVEVKTQSDNVTEGDWILFICGSCIPSMTVPTYIWRKDGHLHSQRHGDNILDLESVGLEDRGQYFCTISGHEGLNSTSVNITVRPGYSPKNVSVSISPSGEIVEGDSVTLNCNSDAKPPAEISWYKRKTFLQSGDTYNITNIKSEASGNYYCSARNKYGSQTSAAVNVMYPPKSVSVSISPSGEIVSGDSVTLNCSSDSNPPALNFSWFKGETLVRSGRIFSISNISSDHSGEYKCRSRNKHGEKNSDTVMLNVIYPPKSVSVSISPSGEIVSGDSVTLNCSSDSNPPALNFSWFKEDETSAVGSGQSFSISSFSSSFSGRFYCEAQNKYGSQRSASVSLTVKGVQRAALHTVSGIVAGCGGLIFIIIIIVFIKRKKRREGGTEDVNQKQTADASDDTYTALDPASRTSADIYSTITFRAPDDTYTALELQSRSSEYENLAVTSADPH
ncbi:B-cell receptor CD22 isoform X4 [Ctenopharyngodon idella]|uniref:B-cell receptor CD22 isoform X4 n=1 Tax=Ctenopharyngodon idella TaxID=7959 RepID=UPI0022305BD8|nr:B-cell receptor CD22 isoform X4 [Ctenopharyngodon idella]